ncbi:MAG: helix-turn-helix domain-containing protein [bacterium]
MESHIPNIEFEHKNATGLGLEMLTLDNIRNRVGNLDHDPGKAHQLTFNLLVFYTKGSGKHLIDFVWHDVQENMVVHLVKGQINAFDLASDLEGYLVVFTDDFLQKQLAMLPKNELVRLFNPHLFLPTLNTAPNKNVRAYFDQFYEEFTNNDMESQKNLISEALFTIIFSKLEALKQDQTTHLKPSLKLEQFLKFKELVTEYFTQSRNADFYAEKLNITYKHLNAICKEILETTAKGFIDDYLILEAKRRLINSSIKSNELAFELGFNEPTNFIKYFKKFTGFTPNQFKKQYQ